MLWWPQGAETEAVTAVEAHRSSRLRCFCQVPRSLPVRTSLNKLGRSQGDPFFFSVTIGVQHCLRDQPAGSSRVSCRFIDMKLAQRFVPGAAIHVVVPRLRLELILTHRHPSLALSPSPWATPPPSERLGRPEKALKYMAGCGAMAAGASRTPSASRRKRDKR